MSSKYWYLVNEGTFLEIQTCIYTVYYMAYEHSHKRECQQLIL